MKRKQIDNHRERGIRDLEESMGENNININ